MSTARVSKFSASPDGELVTIHFDNGQAVGRQFNVGMSTDAVADALSSLAAEVRTAAALPVRAGISDEYARATYVDFSAMMRDTPLSP